jgi:hypothetical protein
VNMQSMRERSGLSATGQAVHEQTLPSALKRDDSDVQLMVNHLENNMTHSFQHRRDPLQHIQWVHCGPGHT